MTLLLVVDNIHRVIYAQYILDLKKKMKTLFFFTETLEAIRDSRNRN